MKIINDRSVFFYFGLILLMGCATHKAKKIPESIRKLKNLTVYSPDAKPDFKITLDKDAVYGDTTGVVLGSFITGVAVDNRKRTYIADFAAKRIDVFNPDGSFFRYIGRNGRGPGEFQYIWKIRIKDNYLYALDYFLQKISVFNLLTMQLVRDDYISLNRIAKNKPSWLNHTRKNGWIYRATNFYVLPNGNYLIFFSNDGESFANLRGNTYEASIFSPDSEKYLEHNVFSFPWTGGIVANKNVIITRVPYKRMSQFDYTNGQLVYGWTGDFLFKFYNGKGTYQRAIYYPFHRLKLNLKDALASLDNSDSQSMEAIRGDALPSTWPAFHSVLMDNKNRLWVSTFARNQKVYRFWVLNQNGKLLARFTWPRDKLIKVVKNGYMYTQETDTATGISQIVRYRIEMKPY